MQLFILPSASAQLTKLRAAYSAASSWSLATWVAFDAGLFRKHGLDVDLVLIRSATTITSALIASETPMIQLGANPESLAAMKAGAISVGSLSPPVLTAAKKAGFKDLGDFESLDYKYPALAIATTKSFVQRQRAAALNFLRGEMEIFKASGFKLEGAAWMKSMLTLPIVGLLLLTAFQHARAADPKPGRQAVWENTADLSTAGVIWIFPIRNIPT
jgi:ABC-type nitrate/sulfonate/bicarbonate transport system substrate-binding protein